MIAVQEACTLSPAHLQSRLQKLTNEVAPHIRATKRTATGFAFALPHSPAHLAMAEDFIRFERACCGFARFSLRSEPEAGLHWVAVEVPEPSRPQARAAVRQMYAELKRTAPRRRRWAPSLLLGSGAVFAALCCATPMLAVALGALGLGHAAQSVGPWFDAIALGLAVAAMLFAWSAYGRRPSPAASAKASQSRCKC